MVHGTPHFNATQAACSLRTSLRVSLKEVSESDTPVGLLNSTDFDGFRLLFLNFGFDFYIVAIDAVSERSMLERNKRKINTLRKVAYPTLADIKGGLCGGLNSLPPPGREATDTEGGL